MEGTGDDGELPPARSQARETVRSVSASLTRGFLFADLRDYTRYVEAHGAAAAVALLDRYRALVREAVARYRGAEIKTEGDSFYVVFPAVSAAVQCGLAIVNDAAESASGEEALRIGIGIHAGETVETPEGYVGSPVNIAARICSIARPGQVLVSDTVRALTQTVLPVTFTPLGRRHLKGVSEPLMLYVVVEGARAGPPARAPQLRRSTVIGLGATALVVAAGIILWWQARPPAQPGPTPTRPAAGLRLPTVKIALDMPLTGPAADLGIPVRNAVQLAIDEATASGGVAGSRLELDAYDDAGDTPNGQDPQRGLANARAAIQDDAVVAMIGPWTSSVAYAMIPVTNESGLFQCSPANTHPELTKPRFGAEALRSARPDHINYVRLAPSDDIQGPALAAFAFHELRATTALVIDDAQIGVDVAQSFAESYEALGGQTVRRSLLPGADPADVLHPLADPAEPATLVFFGGFTATGGADLRVAMVAAGYGHVPFLSWDGMFDGSGQDQGSFIARAGAAAADSYVAHASVAPPKAAFAERYRAAYGSQPDEYAPAGYACAEIVLEALDDAAGRGLDAEGLREAVRAYAVDTRHRYETVLGTLGFDANGDSTQQFVTFYRVDTGALGGKGDWILFRQQDFGPAP